MRIAHRNEATGEARVNFWDRLALSHESHAVMLSTDDLACLEALLHSSRATAETSVLRADLLREIEASFQDTKP